MLKSFLNRQNTWIRLYIMPILLVSLYVSEAYYKIAYFSFGQEPRLGRYIKLIVLCILFIWLFLEKAKKIIPVFFLVLSFCLGQFSLDSRFQNEVIIYFGVYVFPLVLLMFFKLCPLSNIQLKKLFKSFEAILVINSILVIIGVLFNVSQFETYQGSRFGYNGLFVATSTSTYVSAISLIYLLVRYKHNIFKRYTNLLIMLPIIFIGTKSLYAFSLCFMGIYLWEYSSVNKKRIFGFLIALGFLWLYMAFYKYGIFNEIRQKDGIISALMSHRNNLLIEQTIPFIQRDWNIVNYLFGGVEDLKTRSQMDIIDVFYFFGIIGGGMYFYFFFKSFITFKADFSILFLLGMLLIIVLLAGNFFSSPSIAIYLVVLREYFNYNEQNKYS